MVQSIVINNCYGGFGLSSLGVRHYATTKGLVIYAEQNRKLGGHFDFTDYWLVPPEERIGILTEKQWHEASPEKRKASNTLYEKYKLYDLNIKRDDPALIQTVKDLGDKANGPYALLTVVEIPDDVKWAIEEYDGIEWISEVHRTWGRGYAE